MRAERICEGAGDIDVLAETELEPVLETVAAARPALVVVDSVQTLLQRRVHLGAGQREPGARGGRPLLRLAKDTGAAVFLVGHVTKEGAIAGPRVLEHMVDTRAPVRGRPLPRSTARCAPPRTASAPPTSSASSR